MKTITKKLEKYPVSKAIKGVFKLIGIFIIYYFFTILPAAGIAYSGGGKMDMGNIISVTIVLLVGAFGFGFCGKELKLVEWKFRNVWHHLLLIACAAIGILAFQKGVFWLLNVLHHPVVPPANQQFLNQVNARVPLFLMILVTCLFAPICEELIFRAGFFKWVLPYHRIAAWITSSILFASMHMMSDFTNWTAWIIYIESGVIFGFVYFRTDKAECSILTHALSNLIMFFI
ncbi:CPBP family intramembrane glutamic endopeptidase [Lactovum odontotermitis]